MGLFQAGKHQPGAYTANRLCKAGLVVVKVPPVGALVVFIHFDVGKGAQQGEDGDKKKDATLKGTVTDEVASEIFDKLLNLLR